MRDASWAVGAFCLAAETLIRQARWKTVRPDDRPDSRRQEEIVESARHDMEQTWQEFLSEVLSFLPFGWFCAEKVYKLRRGRKGKPPSRHDDGATGWRCLAPRAQESLLSWQWDDDGRVTHMVQSAAPLYRSVPIPMGRILHFRPRSAKNNPEGRSFLRNAQRSWTFEKRIEETEAIGVVRDLAGLVVARVPPEMMLTNAPQAMQDARAQIEEQVRLIDRNEYEGIVFAASEDSRGKTGFDLELLASGGSRQIDTNEIVKRYESRILISVLAEFLMLGMEAHGSFALADSKTNVFAMSLGAILGTICDVLNDDAVPELCELNGYEDPSTYPRIEHGDIETPDLQTMSNFVAALINARDPAGKSPLNASPLLERFLSEYGGLPTPEAPTPTPAPVAPTNGAQPSPMPIPAVPPNGAPPS